MIRLCSSRYLVDTLGFEKHMRQIRKQRGDTVPPIWFKRPSMYGLYLPDKKIKENGDVIIIPEFVKKPDYEFEIVGLFSESIKTDNIVEAVTFVKTKMLFTIMNDMSARDLQAEDMQLPLWVGPSKGVLPKIFGPQWVHGSQLHMDENGVPSMNMRLSVNGSLRCDDNFNSIYFRDPETDEKKCWGFAQVIAWFGKRDQGFEEGHLLGSGTIGNGSIAETGLYPWLTNGDVIRMEAEHIGILENRIQKTAAL